MAVADTVIANIYSTPNLRKSNPILSKTPRSDIVEVGR